WEVAHCYLLNRIVSCLTGINFSFAILNLLPIWPLDGWQIGRVLWEYLRGNRRAQWEQDADWWKSSDRDHDNGAEGANDPKRIPKLVLVILAAVALGCLILEFSDETRTATELMAEFKKDSARAMAKLSIRTVTVKGALRM